MINAKHTRRSFLAMLGLAPLAAPAAIAAATAGAKAATVRFIGGSTPYLGASSRLLVCDEIDPLPWSAAESAAYRQAKLLTWPDGPEKDQINREWGEFMRAMIAREDSARAAISSIDDSCPAFIDDVGSGP